MFEEQFDYKNEENLRYKITQTGYKSLRVKIFELWDKK